MVRTGRFLAPAAALEAVRQPIWLVGPEGEISYANLAAHAWLESESLVKTRVADLCVGGAWSAYGGEAEFVTRTGVVRRAQVDVVASPDGDWWLLSDLSGEALQAKLVGEVQRMRRLAGEDALTGVANRRTFGQALERAKSEPRTGFGILVVDLDDLKMVNDTLGHDAGDQALVAVARRLSHRVRASDLVARLGGDEFAVLMTATGKPDVRETAERIARELDFDWEVAGRTIRLRASVGWAFSGDSPADTVQRADRAMYESKRRREAEGLSGLAEAEQERNPEVA